MVVRSAVRSPWILHFDTGSCNGCDLEIFACLTPRYDIERFGAVNRGNPKHADVLLVTGPVTKKVRPRLLNLFDQMAEPKLVVAVGDCASTGSPFTKGYNVEGGVDKVIPVDVYVPGCAARPEAVMDGLLLALRKWEAMSEGREIGGPGGEPSKDGSEEDEEHIDRLLDEMEDEATSKAEEGG